MNVKSLPATQSAPPRFPAELIDSTPFLLKRVGFAAKEKALEAYERFGLNPTHHAVLAVLDEGSRETQGAIADALGYDRGQLVGLLDELEERGLVERRRDPSDRRRQHVQLTPAGRRTLTRLRAVAQELEHSFLAALSAEERAVLHTTLLRLAEQHLPHCASGSSNAR
jgi:DNA-binding MarR family transcriptional regulator